MKTYTSPAVVSADVVSATKTIVNPPSTEALGFKPVGAGSVGFNL
jgi:hypothetical protein